jgi:hypothetical protein
MTQPLLLAMPDSDIALVTEGAVIGVVLNCVDKGDLSEDAFDMESKRRGWLVAYGRGKGRDFDTIVKRPNLVRPVTVQTRRAQWDNKQKSYQVSCMTASGIYSETAFDVLAVHLFDVDQFVFFLRSEIGSRTGFRYMPAHLRKIKQYANSVPYRDPNNWHLLDEVAESLTANRETSLTPRTADV